MSERSEGDGADIYVRISFSALEGVRRSRIECEGSGDFRTWASRLRAEDGALIDLAKEVLRSYDCEAFFQPERGEEQEKVEERLAQLHYLAMGAVVSGRHADEVNLLVDGLKTSFARASAKTHHLRREVVRLRQTMDGILKGIRYAEDHEARWQKKYEKLFDQKLEDFLSRTPKDPLAHKGETKTEAESLQKEKKA